MTMILAICVGVTFAVSIYLMLGRELKGVAMGVFLLSHAANLSILAMSGSPIMTSAQQAEEQEAQKHLTSVDSPIMKDPPILADRYANSDPLAQMVDPLPQALILTAIVISFGVMAFLLTLIVVTNRKTNTLELDELAEEARQL
ncbi:MAG: sodium:proton antiporter [Phycisphaeraceae bacterium]